MNTSHQVAINALLGLAVSSSTIPRAALPHLFRAAIVGGSQYPEETRILEFAVSLLDTADESPEMREFFSGLAFRWERAGVVRVRYAPKNVN